ncbi:MAG: hypothetical protein KIS92_25415, partial [Planctomycetota bacterium]|nr:hypothetical protein [Planctomycetota bacterium]
MSSVHVLISIPPHDPNADVNVLAAAFARSPAEVRMKAKLALPEVWFGDEDAARVQDLAATLQQAGFRVAAVAGDHLAGVPDASVAEGLLLDDAGIVWDIEESAVQMPADAPVLA